MALWTVWNKTHTVATQTDGHVWLTHDQDGFHATMSASPENWFVGIPVADFTRIGVLSDMLDAAVSMFDATVVSQEVVLEFVKAIMECEKYSDLLLPGSVDDNRLDTFSDSNSDSDSVTWPDGIDVIGRWNRGVAHGRYISNNSFVLFAGSELDLPRDVKRNKRYIKMISDLPCKQVEGPYGPVLVLSSDYEVKYRPSFAAMLVNPKKHNNGWTFWKTIDGRSLGDVVGRVPVQRNADESNTDSDIVVTNPFDLGLFD